MTCRWGGQGADHLFGAAQEREGVRAGDTVLSIAGHDLREHGWDGMAQVKDTIGHLERNGTFEVGHSDCHPRHGFTALRGALRFSSRTLPTQDTTAAASSSPHARLRTG